MTTFLDAHIHLTDKEFGNLLQPTLNILRSLNMKAVSVSVNLVTTIQNLELASSYGDIILPFVGLHPLYNNENTERFANFMSENVEKIAGIGEIGLDKKYIPNNEMEYGKQKKVFEYMLGLAEQFGKPTSIHSRGCVDDVLDILQSYNIQGNLLHWFAGSKKQLRMATDMGCYVSYGPVLVYSEDKRSLLRDTLKELVLVETDGPVRYGRCFQDQVSLPSFLPSVVFTLAKTLGLDYDDACNLLMQNSQKYLNHVL